MKKPYFIIGYIIAITFFICFALHSKAVAEESKSNFSENYAAEMYAGWSIDSEGQGYSYIGVGFDRIISKRWALTAKIFGNYNYYEYDSDLDIVEAKAPGLKVLIGTKHFKRGEYFILTGGLDYRNTSLSPDDKNSQLKGSKTGVIFETLYSKDLSGNFVLDLIASFSSIGDSLWGRGRFKYMLPSFSGDEVKRKVFIGIEGIGEGNSDYSAYRIGPIIELQNVKKKFSVLLDGGYKHTNSISSSGYFGIEFYHRF